MGERIESYGRSCLGMLEALKVVGPVLCQLCLALGRTECHVQMVSSQEAFVLRPHYLEIEIKHCSRGLPLLERVQ